MRGGRGGAAAAAPTDADGRRDGGDGLQLHPQRAGVELDRVLILVMLLSTTGSGTALGRGGPGSLLHSNLLLLLLLRCCRRLLCILLLCPLQTALQFQVAPGIMGAGERRRSSSTDCCDIGRLEDRCHHIRLHCCATIISIAAVSLAGIGIGPGLLPGALLATDHRRRRVEGKVRAEFAHRPSSRRFCHGHWLFARGLAPATLLLPLGVGLQLFISLFWSKVT